MLKLSAYSKYETGDYAGCKGFLEKCQIDDPDVIIVHGCLLYQVIP